jgi:hypothetical protein
LDRRESEFKERNPLLREREGRTAASAGASGVIKGPRAAEGRSELGPWNFRKPRNPSPGRDLAIASRPLPVGEVTPDEALALRKVI